MQEVTLPLVLTVAICDEKQNKHIISVNNIIIFKIKYNDIVYKYSGHVTSIKIVPVCESNPYGIIISLDRVYSRDINAPLIDKTELSDVNNIFY